MDDEPKVEVYTLVQKLILRIIEPNYLVRKFNQRNKNPYKICQRKGIKNNLIDFIFFSRLIIGRTLGIFLFLLLSQKINYVTYKQIILSALFESDTEIEPK